ncbi:hypothetical protein IW261DRAFT_1548415 [Armillaria novae-zelandiae]|uniref:NAD-dependent epimerase/dehydratase domain-containing protein n=1 Tax=Armillaria novae-zelandiae TaxID=153914 RepID=A0AA39UPM0_9AGAR|nr:hypothetical protein IW261DRAFT_1548415 [Armillaria novae-zelandiae]
MTILITGGTGKTGSRLARRLLDVNYLVFLTSRKGVVPEPFKGVKFDWCDPSTFENPFTVDPDMDRIYIVAPDGGCAGEVIEPMKPFIDLVVTKGRIAGGPSIGMVHEYLLSLQVDYAILRPSWFYGNCSPCLGTSNLLTMHLHDIKESNTIVTVSADGMLGFVSADDIADLAFEALTNAKSHNTDHILTGPELLSYDDIAHARISVEELKDRYIAFGLPEDFATLLSSMDELNASGVEESIFGTPGKVTGRRMLRDFIEANKDSF